MKPTQSLLLRSITILILAPAAAVAARADDWERFRGPGCSGVEELADVPTQWSATQNVAWKTAMPGPGASSPIVHDGRIFLTCYSGYGLEEDEPGPMSKLQHVVVCVDGKTGEILWQQSTPADQPEREYRGFVALHGYASGTPVTDGKAVYAFFGRSGVVAYDMDGKLLWRADVGKETHNWGSGASPIIYRSLLIVNASVESESVVALNRETGREVWRVGDIVDSWSTPAIVALPDGSQELVVSLHSKVVGIQPVTGSLLWHCDSVPDYVCPSVIANDGIAYITGGRKPTALAVRAGGRGDVTDSHILWQIRETPKVPTPLYHDGLLYWVSNRGIACCIDAETGDEVYQERLDDMGRVYASVVLLGGNLYAVSRENGTVVYKPGRALEVVARNDLDDPSIFNATPTPMGDRLLIRSDKYLYCVGD